MPTLHTTALDNAPYGSPANHLIKQKAAAVIALTETCDETELDQGTRSQIQQLVTLVLDAAGRKRANDLDMSERDR